MHKTRIIRADPHPKSPPRRPNPELARVIGQTEQRAARRARQRVEHAEQRAQDLLQQARAEAEQILAAAHEEAAALRARELATVHQTFARRGQALLDELRADLTALGVRIAEKLLGEQLDLAPESVTQLVGQVLRSVGPLRQAVIRAHPLDVPLLEGQLVQLQDAGGVESLAIKVDETLPRGGCVLDTPLGQVDGRVETQLKTIAAALQQPD